MFDNLDELTDEELVALEKKIQARRGAEDKRKEELRRMLNNYSFDTGYIESGISDALNELGDHPEWLENDDIRDKLEEIEAACSELEGMVSDLETLVNEQEERDE